jgi:hypothetical protein
MLGHSKMDELLTDKQIPYGADISGNFDAESGWSARYTPYITRPGAPPGSAVLERVELELWWMSAGQRRTFLLEGYRRNIVPVPGQ